MDDNNKGNEEMDKTVTDINDERQRMEQLKAKYLVGGQTSGDVQYAASYDVRPDPSNSIPNYHERDRERIALREDQDLRLKCLQTTLQFANGDMEKATREAMLAYVFITGSVTNGQ